jgi:hypothetical protein
MGVVSEAEAMHQPRGLMQDFIESDVGSEEFEVTDAAFTADFLLQRLPGVLVPILYEPDGDRFLVPACELARKILGG